MSSSERVVWHDVECGGYEADLPLWEELAVERGGPILELGCGAGRVVLHLARATGQLVIGLERDDELLAAVWDRASGGLEGDAEFGDVRGFDLHARFELVLAPMQLIQLLPEKTDRICCLSCVADHLEPGGRAAFAIVEEVPALPASEVAPPIPDVRQVDDWVYSSLPMPPEVRDDAIVLRRLRQVVAPDGKLSEATDEVILQMLSADALEQEGTEMGLIPIGRREIPATDAHVGSTVVLLEAP
jgi:SAM-dependent methyltransferase